MKLINSIKERKNWQKIIYLIMLLSAIEIISFSSFYLPVFAIFTFISLNIIFLFLAIKKSYLAIAIVFSELIISSMGHMFFFDFAGQRLSIRMSFWFILILVFLFKFFFQLRSFSKDAIYWQRIKNFSFIKIFSFLAFFVVLSLLISFVNNNSLTVVFSDFNSWLFYLLIFPCLTMIDFNKKEHLDSFRNIIIASLVFLSLKTLFFLLIFSHNLSFAGSVYTWLRGTLMAEITINNFWSRIFLQSQIFSAFAFFVLLFLAQKEINLNSSFRSFFSKKNLALLFLSALFLSTLILSFSRSFWLALIFVLFLIIVLNFIYFNFKNTFKLLAYLLGSSLLAIFLIYLVLKLPISSSTQVDFNKGLSERITQDSNEPALASRWSLLPVLWGEITEAPFFGKGFGRELTYFSSDPRVLERNPSGEYKTFAFEWGYLDIWLKMGVFALFTYFLLLSKIIFAGFKKGLQNDIIFLGFSFSLVFLAVVNFFTPYLNHPLGIGLIILSTCIIQENKVYLNKN